ncbi:uncharacterized protein LOC131166292 [Malania oleifera]|uniref:uncharacterized protein LOC131166292 n=1 Tax=Malania oleifera TaxID=397392 RepID=UPI0025ADE968|nr:uncharacterized protein LOC131166292 [Malania oleifera]
MITGGDSLKLLFLLPILHQLILHSASAICELGVVDRNRLYNYTLASPTRNFPHGVLSEDGFYRVAVNGSVLWFQLCDRMIFNHDPPKCVECLDCGGPSRCGMGCSALVSNNIGGYHVCTTIGHASNMDIDLIDKRNPHIGVTIKMSSSGSALNCSLSVSVVCDSKRVKGPNSFKKIGGCDYSTELRHPSGCAEIVSIRGKGWGWFGTLMVIFFCLFGAYLLAGTVYRFFALGVRGIDVIPNLDFWTSLPRRLKSLFISLVRKFRGPSQGYRTSYSPVNF